MRCNGLALGVLLGAACTQEHPKLDLAGTAREPLIYGADDRVEAPTSSASHVVALIQRTVLADLKAESEAGAVDTGVVDAGVADAGPADANDAGATSSIGASSFQ